MGKFIDLTGQKYGRLTVLERGPNEFVGKTKIPFVRWVCRCDCGNEVIVRGNDLKSGHTKSCGCLRVDEAVKNGHANTKCNRYEFDGQLVIGYTTKGERFFFDKEDFDLVSQYCWYKHHSGYIYSNVNRAKQVLLHRLVMNAGPGEYVDHINHQLENACKANLRIVSLTQNACNSKTSCKNTSGYKGVTYQVRNSKWLAQLRINGVYHYLGRYGEKEEAIAARKAAEEKYFGEYSYENSIAASPVIEIA